MLKRKVLIVEDNEGTASTLADYLRMNSFDCDIALNGKEASRFFEKGAYQIVLLDVALPDTDGLAVGRECLQHQPDTKIIFLTASSLDISNDPFFSHATLLTKPCKPGDILREIIR